MGLGEDAELEGLPVVASPVGPGGDATALLVVWAEADEPAGEVGTAPPGQAGVVDSLAGQAVLALELSRARADRERLLIAEDRERIARDLHDVVIQQLFASGMSLQASLPLMGDERAAERVAAVVDSLDRVISEIRTAIFALGTPADGAVRSDLLAVAREAAEQLGFAPRVHFVGPVDTTVPLETAAHLLAVAREALSNAARHARAHDVEVVLSVGDEVDLVVRDDGVGMGGATRQSGLANLRQRAEGLGGTLLVTSGDGGGTCLEWRVPLRR